METQSDLKATQKAIQSKTYVVHSETDLNNAIATINAGGDTTCSIDVQSGFTLSADVTGVTSNVTILSSNGSIINDGGFSFLTITNNAKVRLSMNAGGTGTINLEGNGYQHENTLEGLTGGVVANVSIANNGCLLVNSGEVFQTGAVFIDPISGGTINGTLNNTGIITVSEGIISNQPNTQPVMNDVNLVWESYLKIAPGTVFSVGDATVQLICAITSDGTGTLESSGEILLIGDPNGFNLPGQITGVNVNGSLVLTSNGLYSGSIDSPSTPGGNATTVINKSGVFDLGHVGAWTVGTYHQTKGILKLSIPDFEGNAPLLTVGSANFTGGAIHIDAEKYFVPPGTISTTMPIFNFVEFSSSVPLASMVVFKNFPEGITPSIIQFENVFFLSLTVDQN